MCELSDWEADASRHGKSQEARGDLVRAESPGLHAHSCTEGQRVGTESSMGQEALTTERLVWI